MEGIACPVRPGAPHPAAMADVGGPPATLVAMSLRGALPWTLIAAAGLVSVEALVACVVVAQRDELPPGLRAGHGACIALTGLAAGRILHRSAGAAQTAKAA